jgi:uncharacterized protein (TIGR02466 family)
MTIHQLFPVRIYSEEVSYKPSDHAAAIALMERLQRTAQWQNGAKQAFNSVTGDRVPGATASQFHRLAELDWLARQVVTSAHQYLTDLGAAADAYQVHIQKAWPVIVGAGHGLNRHRHRNAHLSGVYYLGPMPKTSGALTFQRSDTHPEEFLPIYAACEQRWHWQPREGQLVLFPSELEHLVEPHRGSENRYSISFDLLISTHNRNRLGNGNEMLMTHPGTWRLDEEG